jgi:hypothetical protein
MSESYVPIKDASGANKNLRSQLVNGAHAMARVLYDATGTTALTPAKTRDLAIYRDLDLDETGISVKASAGSVLSLHLSSAASGALYVKLYNKATAPTVGTDTPVLTFRVRAGEDRDVPIPADGIPFALGIGIGCTTAFADADTGAPGANEMVVNLTYE